MKTFNYMYGTFMILLAAIAFYVSGTFVNIGGYDIGPAAYPRVVSIIIVLLSAALIVSTVIDKRLSGKLADLFNQREFTKVIFSLVLFVFYFFSMKYLGFFVATLLFMIVSLWLLKVQSWLKILAMSILFTSIVFFIFRYVLYIKLPEGFLG